MNRYPQLLSLMVLLAAPITLAQDSSGANETDSWDRYRVLSERNIFVRDRGVLSESRPVPEQTARAIDDDDSDRYLLLTATVQRGRESIAFVEDTRSRDVFESLLVKPTYITRRLYFIYQFKTYASNYHF